MANKAIKMDRGVAVRLDEVYTTNEKHLVSPYVDANTGAERYFGSVKFLQPKEAKKTMQEAVKMLGSEVQDTVFSGQYPKWVEDNYGTSMNISGRLKFYTDTSCTKTVPDLDIRDYIYSLEVHLTPTKDNQIFLRGARAIAVRKSEGRYNDELFEEETKDGNLTPIDIVDDDLPF